jgi:DNA-binding response OmpR family regulator
MKHILIIDDEQPVQEMLRLYFSRHGYVVATAATAAEAREFVETGPTDFVICDIDIGGEDGLELSREIGRRLPGVPVIMLTGMGCDAELMHQAEGASIAGWFSKTLPMDQLLGEVRRLQRAAESQAGREKPAEDGTAGAGSTKLSQAKEGAHED